MHRRNSQRVFGYEQSDQRLRAGLAVHYLWGGSGNTWIDQSGYGNHGSLNNGPVWTIGEGGKRAALGFDGTNDYVVGANLVNTARVTLSAWIKIFSTPSQNGMVMGFVNSLGSAVYDKILYIGTDGKPYFYIYDGASKTTSAPASALPLNEWVHLTAVADGVNASVYANGVQVGTVAAGDTYTGYTVPNVFINGVTGATLSATYLNAFIDDPRVYTRGLSEAEVALLANPVFKPLVSMGRRIAERAASPILLTPTPAVYAWVGNTPTKIIGGITRTPTTAIMAWLGNTPTKILGALTLTPVTAIVNWVGLAATAIRGAGDGDGGLWLYRRRRKQWRK